MVMSENTFENLSDRELQVLCLLASGKKTCDIASGLSLSPSTVATYRSRALLKLNLRNSADLARFAAEHRLI